MEKPGTTGGPNDAPDLRGPPALAIFLAVAGLGTALDLWTKHLAFTRIQPFERVEVIPGVLDFILARNTGAAFSMLAGKQGFFIAVSVVALALLGWFSYTARGSGVRYQVTLGLLAAGVVGNFYDRVKYEYVRDFIDVYVSNPQAMDWLREKFGTNHWPTFNVADAFIVVGTGLLLIKFWRDEKRMRRHKEIHDANRDSRI